MLKIKKMGSQTEKIKSIVQRKGIDLKKCLKRRK